MASSCPTGSACGRSGSTAGATRSPPGATRSPPSSMPGRARHDLDNDLAGGRPRCWNAPPPGVPRAASRSPAGRRRRRCALPGDPVTRAGAGAVRTEVTDTARRSTRCANWSPAVSHATASGSTGRWPAAAPGTSCFPRSTGALGRRRASPVSRHLRDGRRGACPASPRWASMCSTCRRFTRSARTNRKGRNNALTAGPDDPGEVPYAIRGAEGGHTAIHPQLGTLEDFRALVVAARRSRDRDRTGFRRSSVRSITLGSRNTPNGSSGAERRVKPEVRGEPAQNATKTSSTCISMGRAFPAVWEALRDVVLYWAAEGVRIFRVDNPHTKPHPVLGVAARRGPRRPIRTCCSSPRRSPGRR